MQHFSAIKLKELSRSAIDAAVSSIRTDRRVFLGVIALLMLSVAIPSFQKVLQSSDSAFFLLKGRSDFEDYYRAAKAISNGKDPYHTEQIEELQRGGEGDLPLTAMIPRLKGVGSYLYPPFTAFLLLPVSGFGYETAVVLYQIGSFLALIVFFFYIYRHLQTLGFSAPSLRLAIVLPFLIVYAFLLGNGTNGNILFFLLLLAGPGLFFSLDRRRIVSFAGGMLLGFAAVIKITPGFLGLLLLSRGRWLAIAGMACGAVLALLVPAVSVGWEQNLELLFSWKELVLDSYGKYGFVRAWANNQSISGMIGKLFIPGSDLKQATFGLPLTGADVTDLARLRIYVVIVRVINGGLVLFGLAVSLLLLSRSGEGDNGKRDLLRFSQLLTVAILISLLTAGVSWYHAYGILLLPLVIRLALHGDGVPLLRGERYSLHAIAFFGLFDIFLSRQLHTALAMYSLFTLVALGTLFYLSFLLIGSRNGL